VLLCIARDPDVRLRDIADAVGVTLGSAQRILADLVQAGYVQRERRGRRNRYQINRDAPMVRHAAQRGRDIGGFLDLLRLEERS
jgi:DNA-binding IclR family transcriptional regulator